MSNAQQVPRKRVSFAERVEIIPKTVRFSDEIEYIKPKNRKRKSVSFTNTVEYIGRSDTPSRVPRAATPRYIMGPHNINGGRVQLVDVPNSRLLDIDMSGIIANMEEGEEIAFSIILRHDAWDRYGNGDGGSNASE